MSDSKENQGAKKTRKPWWRRLLKWTGITLAAAIVLFVVVCTLIVWTLTPGRLTPLVERMASDYLRADLKIERVELTFWHTFPRMTVEVDSLRLDSHSLDSAPDSVRDRLPADYRRLLSIGHFKGGINVVPLLKGDISLYDVAFDRLSANLIQATDSLSNYDIVPPSEEKDEKPVSVPSISINRFEITDAAPLRYRSLINGADYTASLQNVTLDGHNGPEYRLKIEGGMHSPVLDAFNFDQLVFGADGSIVWESQRPMAVTLRDFMFTLAKFHVRVDTEVDFTDNLVVKSFEARFPDIPLSELVAHAPAEFQPLVRPLQTDMQVTSALRLLRPWNPADTLLPTLEASVEVPPCALTYQNLKLTDVSLKVLAMFDGSDLDASWVDLQHLHAVGDATSVDIDAKVTKLITDPYISGNFRGTVNLGALPPSLKARIPVGLQGKVEGNTAFRLHKSDLSRDNFHRIYATGALDLHDIHADAQGMLSAYMRHAALRFGTDSHVTADTGNRVDSLLTVTLKIDTLAADGMGMNLELRGFSAGVGSTNRASSADTTEINPFGGRISIDRLKFMAASPDTMRARIAKASVGASLRRFKGGAKSPLLNLDISAGRLMVGQSLTKFALSKTDARLTVHLNEARANRSRSNLTDEQRAARRKARADSLGRLPQQENLDLRLDGKERRLLRNWDYNGHLKAERGRLVTPYLPLANRLRDIDITFNQDSLNLNNVYLKSGQSDFSVKGTVSNIRRALTARRDNTIKLELRLASDTLNVNQLVHAIFTGQAVAANADARGAVWDDDAEDSQQQHLAEIADTAAMQPLLLPHNVDASIRVRGNHVLYSDMVLDRFTGNLLLYDGVLNLRRLGAHTDIGSINVDGLYSATSVDSLQFAMGMKVNNFKLDRLTAIVPAIDSIMPMMQNLAGVVNADVAVTTDITPQMDIDIPSLKGALKIEGQDLVLLDPATFKTLSKWLLFKDKGKNMIDSMAVEAVIYDSAIEVYPFIFNIDRYRLGVMGHNDLDMNLDYHVSVLKSPIPFKFGINIKGTPEKMRIRLGGAKVKPGMKIERQNIASDTRVNLVEQINSLFRRGMEKARKGRLRFPGTRPTNQRLADDDRLGYADSLQMIRAGLIENPDTLRYPPAGGAAEAIPSPSATKQKRK